MLSAVVNVSDFISHLKQKRKKNGVVITPLLPKSATFVYVSEIS
jgi:hypothetical protein